MIARFSKYAYEESVKFVFQMNNNCFFSINVL